MTFFVFTNNLYLHTTRSASSLPIVTRFPYDFVIRISKDFIEDQYLLQQEQAGGYGSSPSGDVVMETLDRSYGKMQLGAIETQISTNLQKMAKILPQFKRKRTSVILAVDLHDEEYYGKHLLDPKGREITMFGQLKNRSGNVSGNKRKVFRYATAAIVSFGKKLQIPITIAFAVNYKGQTRDDILSNICNQILPLNLKIEFMVLDGGFASTRCFRFLNSLKIPFLSRGKLYKKKTYPISDLNFVHVLRGNDGPYNVNAYIIEQRSPVGGIHRMMYLSSDKTTPKLLVRFYGKRFRIENTYRHARVSKIRTSTRKVHLRWMLFAISLLLELVWEIIRYIGMAIGARNYCFRQKLIHVYFQNFLEEQLIPAKKRFE
ncbi:MAG: transposase [Candidatus Heimdallarchaeota archaeon]|nr:transposase [Candidatus Heimdallarchaeota archaeon]MDH5645429.1 transposase [Candidatus Heimdallarchaeota archaeon]